MQSGAGRPFPRARSLGNDWHTLQVGCRQGDRQGDRQAGLRAEAAKVKAKAKAGGSWVAVARLQHTVAPPSAAIGDGERAGERQER